MPPTRWCPHILQQTQLATLRVPLGSVQLFPSFHFVRPVVQPEKLNNASASELGNRKVAPKQDNGRSCSSASSPEALLFFRRKSSPPRSPSSLPLALTCFHLFALLRCRVPPLERRVILNKRCIVMGHVRAFFYTRYNKEIKYFHRVVRIFFVKKFFLQKAQENELSTCIFLQGAYPVYEFSCTTCAHVL